MLLYCCVTMITQPKGWLVLQPCEKNSHISFWTAFGWLVFDHVRKIAIFPFEQPSAGWSSTIQEKIQKSLDSLRLVSFGYYKKKSSFLNKLWLVGLRPYLQPYKKKAIFFGTAFGWLVLDHKRKNKFCVLESLRLIGLGPYKKNHLFWTAFG